MLSIFCLFLLSLAPQVFCSIITSTTVPDDEVQCYDQCFHKSAEFCPSDNRCRCKHLPNCKKAAVCCNVDNFTLKEGLGCGGIYSYF